MLPIEYFKPFVEPNLEEHARYPLDLRIAMNLAVSLFHLADAVALSSGRKPADVVKEVTEACWQFGLIHDVATAYKHIKSGPNAGKRNRFLRDIVGVGPYQGSAWDDGTFWDDGTGWADEAVCLVIANEAGQKYDFSIVANDLAEYWRNALTTT